MIKLWFNVRYILRLLHMNFTPAKPKAEYTEADMLIVSISKRNNFKNNNK